MVKKTYLLKYIKISNILADINGIKSTGETVEKCYIKCFGAMGRFKLI